MKFKYNDLTKLMEPIRTIECTSKLWTEGSFEVLIDGEVRRSGKNLMLAGMGRIFARTLRDGQCKEIEAIKALKSGDYGRTNFSTPSVTAGGVGATDYITVQSTYTNSGAGAITFVTFWLVAGSWDEQPGAQQDIALVSNDSVTLNAGSTLTINWTQRLSSSASSFSNAQRYSMIAGLHPTLGGTTYYLSQGRFGWAGPTWTALQATHDITGGTGFEQEITVDTRYTHAAAGVTVTDFEAYNDNGDLVEAFSGYSENLANGETIRALHTTTFLGSG